MAQRYCLVRPAPELASGPNLSYKKNNDPVHGLLWSVHEEDNN